MSAQSPAGGDAEAREAAALAVARHRFKSWWPSAEVIAKAEQSDPADAEILREFVAKNEVKLLKDADEIRGDISIAIDAYLAKLTSTKAEPCRIAEIRGFESLFSGAYNISQSLLSAADKFEVGEINAVALFQLVRRDGELLHQIAEEAPPSKLLDDTISHITAIEADRDRMRGALDSIRQYGADTLSGRADGGPDDRDWQRDAVREMTRRARTALNPSKPGEG